MLAIFFYANQSLRNIIAYERIDYKCRQKGRVGKAF